MDHWGIFAALAALLIAVTAVGAALPRRVADATK
jgi:hypothetical protein